MERAGERTREGLTSPDSPMKWQVIGVVSLSALALTSPVIRALILIAVFFDICIMYAAQLASQAQRLKGQSSAPFDKRHSLRVSVLFAVDRDWLNSLFPWTGPSAILIKLVTVMLHSERN